MAYPNLKQSIWLTVLFLLISAGLSIVVAIVGYIVDEPLGEYNLLNGLLMLTSWILILCYVSRRTDRTWADMLPLAIRDIDCNWRVWLSVGLSIVGLVIMVSELSKAVIYVLPMPEAMQDFFRKLIGKETSYLSALFTVALVAPLVEEVLYRGIILRGLLAHRTPNWAIFWSAILFAAFHLIPWQFPVSFILGIVFAWWVIQTGSLWPAILGHTLNNFLVVTLTHFELPGFSMPDDLNVIIYNPWWLNVCGSIVAALGLWWFYRVAKQKGSGPLATRVELEDIEEARKDTR